MFVHHAPHRPFLQPRRARTEIGHLWVCLHGWLKWLGVSNQESFGLDNSTYTVENVPLQRPARPELKLVRE